MAALAGLIQLLTDAEDMRFSNRLLVCLFTITGQMGFSVIALNRRLLVLHFSILQRGRHIVTNGSVAIRDVTKQIWGFCMLGVPFILGVFLYICRLL